MDLEKIAGENLEVNGLSGLTGDEFDQVIEGMGKLPRGSAVRRKLTSALKKGAGSVARGIVSTTNLTAKAEFERRLSLIKDRNIVSDIQSGEKQIVDGRIYSNKLIGGLTSLELMANADTKAVGVTNVNNRKLEAGQIFLATHIRLLSAVEASDAVKSANYAAIPSEIFNGELSLEVGSTKLLPENFPCSAFSAGLTGGQTEIGLYKLQNPKFINPQEEIKPEIKIPVAATAHTCIKFEILGATLEKR